MRHPARTLLFCLTFPCCTHTSTPFFIQNPDAHSPIHAHTLPLTPSVHAIIIALLLLLSIIIITARGIHSFLFIWENLLEKVVARRAAVGISTIF